MDILNILTKYYGGKNMIFVTDNEKVYGKYNEIWEVIRKLLKVKFTANPVRDDKYLVAKLKIFNRINRTTFLIIIIIIIIIIVIIIIITIFP